MSDPSNQDESQNADDKGYHGYNPQWYVKERSKYFRWSTYVTFERKFIKWAKPFFSFTNFCLALDIIMFVVEMLVNKKIGYSFFGKPKVKTIRILGGENVVDIICKKQFYRVFASMALHVDILHLILNLGSHLIALKACERSCGALHTAAIYVLSSVCSSIMCLPSSGKNSTACGASSALFGVEGAYIVFMFCRQDIFSRKVIESHIKNFLASLLLNTLYFSFLNKKLTIMHHLYGILAGALLGGCLFRKDKRGRLISLILLFVVCCYFLHRCSQWAAVGCLVQKKPIKKIRNWIRRIRTKKWIRGRRIRRKN